MLELLDSLEKAMKVEKLKMATKRGAMVAAFGVTKSIKTCICDIMLFIGIKVESKLEIAQLPHYFFIIFVNWHETYDKKEVLVIVTIFGDAPRQINKRIILFCSKIQD